MTRFEIRCPLCDENLGRDVLAALDHYRECRLWRGVIPRETPAGE